MSDMSYEEYRNAKWLGPIRVAIEIDGKPYTGGHTRRAIRAAMTRAGVEECTVNGMTYTRYGLAWVLTLS
jgi:hypothetical protein